MNPLEENYLNITRRQFFAKTAGGLGAGLGLAALQSLFGSQGSATIDQAGDTHGFSQIPHFAPKAKRVIYLHMMGGPSQLDLFDYKPQLHEHRSKDLRELPEVFNNQRITGMTSGQGSLPIAPSIFKFDRYENNADGLWVSELLPHTAKLAKELCVVKSMFTEAINHEPGVSFIHTGSQLPGRPSIGAWLSYGLGTENADLPAFIVMISQGAGNMQTLSSRLWSAGFLPSDHQAVNFRQGNETVLYLKDPKGISRSNRRRMLDAANALNQQFHQSIHDPEVLARITQAETAYRMQMSVPELNQIDQEDPKTLELYGPEVNKPGSFARNCLLARRLAERGVRFIQLYHRGWDAHGNLPHEIKLQCQAVDQPQAALIQDLKQRGLLEDTLVVWGGEFGRTVYSQGKLTKTTYGRDHHPRCFTMWLAGGGVKPGITFGETDPFGYNILSPDGSPLLAPDKHHRNPGAMHVHDLQATILHQLGLDHKKLTYRHQGRNHRLTDVAGFVNHDILS